MFRSVLFVATPILFVAITVVGPRAAIADEPAKIDGKELFVREWVPNDSRSHGGDGLGPVFNDTSCVACHNQGGVGGAGPRGKNAMIITAFKNAQDGVQQMHVRNEGTLSRLVTNLFGGGGEKAIGEESRDEKEAAKKETIRKERERLAKLHPGFRTARSVVLHHFGIDEPYALFRSRLTGSRQFGFQTTLHNGSFTVEGEIAVPAEQIDEIKVRADKARRRAMASQQVNRLKQEVQMLGASQFFGPSEVDGFVFIRSERQPISLFGSGKIDSIPEQVIIDGAKQKHDGFPEITGRAAKLKDGRIGRFGWKAQKASLNDFVVTACAVELGLHVPGEPQAGVPHNPKYKAPGLDLNKDEVAAMVSYIATLPAPQPYQATASKQKEFISGGKALFAKVGCAACHTPELGDVKGLYSDLLVHDMGPDLGDSGQYGSFAPDSTEDEELNEPVPPLVVDRSIQRQQKPEDESKLVGAKRLEWRTPPLWGVRDSAPYLHDGRAATLEQAVALHGGEASKVTHNYFSLSAEERLKVTAFLHSLIAPGG